MSKKFTLKTFRARSDWDPIRDSDCGTLSATASSRIKRDLLSIFTEPPPGLFVVGDETNLKIIYALILGVMDTPYEGGFFYFVLKCPNDYPIHPPKVKLMTTDSGRVRFNPNIYSNGKVCLSILGWIRLKEAEHCYCLSKIVNAMIKTEMFSTLNTWEGPSWSPAQQLCSLLLSIQSLMNEKPYFNEPGYVKEEIPGDAKRYNEYIQHETLRVAVCGMLENESCITMPEQLRNIMEKTFLEFYDQYIEVVKSNLHLDGSYLIDPFSKGKHLCRYKSILERLEKLYMKLTNKNTSVVNVPQSQIAEAKDLEKSDEIEDTGNS